MQAFPVFCALIDGLAELQDGILSHNPLCYCKNSPVMNADADGKFLAAICAAIGATVVKAVVGAVVGAIVNCASEYVDDVVENYQKGKRGWDMFVPDSPAEKYAGAAVGGAIAWNWLFITFVDRGNGGYRKLLWLDCWRIGC